VKRSVVVKELASLLPLVGIALLFWFLLVRPASKRQREVRHMQASLGVGDAVMLTSGIYGVLRSLDDDDRLRIEIAPGVVVEAARGAVGQKVPSAAQAASEGTEAEPRAETVSTTEATDHDNTETTGER
jgi:preprotein translocase subunit YajC